MERKDLIVEWRSTGNGMDYLLWLEYKLMNEKPRSDVELERYKEALELIAYHLDNVIPDYNTGVFVQDYQKQAAFAKEVALKALTKD